MKVARTRIAHALDLVSLLLVSCVFLAGTQLGGAALPHETWFLCGVIFAAAACAFLSATLVPAPPARAYGTDLNPYHPAQFRRTLVVLALLLLGLVWFQTADLPPGLQKIVSPYAAHISEEFASGLDGVADWDEEHVQLDVVHSVSLAPQATRRAAVTLTAGIALFFTILLAARTTKAVYYLIITLLVSGTLQTGQGMYQSFLTGELVQGTYPNRNYFAGVLEMIAPLAIALTINKRAEHRQNMSRKERVAATVSATAGASWRVGLIALYLCFGATLFLSRSRMGVIGFGIGILAMVFYYARTRWTKLRGQLFLGSLAAVTVLLVGSVLLRDHPTMTRFSLLVSGEDVGASTRVEVWKDSIEIFLHSPVLGVGLGAFGSTLQLFQASSWQAPHFQYAHNDWLNLLTDVGVLGFAIVVIGLFSCLRRFLYLRGQLRTYQRGLLCGIFAGVVAILVHSLVDFNLQVPANAFLFAGLLGTGVAIVELPEPWRKRHRRRDQK